MPYVKRPLPPFPCEKDVWDILKDEKRPIVVYGMGNGADKLIERFEQYGIEVSDFFASDGFVRGHSFRGKRVKSFSEIKESYSEFVIVLSFASNRDEVISMLEEIDNSYDMLVPDMPIASKIYFDRDFYNLHYGEIKKAYDSLADDESRSIFSSVVNYRLSGRMSYLLETYSEKREKYDLIGAEGIETVVDAGAYNGDTAKEAIEYFRDLKTLYAIEPDRRNYKKLVKFAEECEGVDIIPINSACYSYDGVGSFADSGNRNSSIDSTASHEYKSLDVELVKIDSIVKKRVDYVKYDVEGAEAEALIGSEETIGRDYPALSVSLYHKSEDLFALVNTLAEKHPVYSLYLRRTRCIPAWEIDLIMIRKQNIDFV